MQGFRPRGDRQGGSHSFGDLGALLVGAAEGDRQMRWRMRPEAAAVRGTSGR